MFISVVDLVCGDVRVKPGIAPWMPSNVYNSQSQCCMLCDVHPDLTSVVLLIPFRTRYAAHTITSFILDNLPQLLHRRVWWTDLKWAAQKAVACSQNTFAPTKWRAPKGDKSIRRLMSHWVKGRFNRATIFQISLFFKNKNSRKHFRILQIERTDKYLEPFAFQHLKKKKWKARKYQKLRGKKIWKVRQKVLQ